MINIMILKLIFIEIIDKISYVFDTAYFGKGIIIHYGVYVGPDTSIGNFCHLDTNCIIEHDCNLGSNVLVCPGVIIENDVFIGAGTTIINSTINKEIRLHEKCFTRLVQ